MISKRLKAESNPASPAPARRTRSASATHSRKATAAVAADSVTPVPVADAVAAEPAPRKRAARKKVEAAVTTPETMVETVPVDIPRFAITHEMIAGLAYSYWEARGDHGGSQEEDWFRAEQELRSRL